MGVTDIMTILGTPAASGLVIWYLMSKQAVLLEKISDGMGDLKTRVAVHESRAAMVDDMRKDMAKMRDDLTIAKGMIDAAWKEIDNLKRK